MNRLKWWFLIVGVLYLLMGIGFIPFINEARLPTIFPDLDAPKGGAAHQGILDFRFMFGLDLTVIGAFLFYALRDPQKHMPVVLLVVALEIVRGILDEFYMLVQGYAAPFYIGFIIFHLIIVVTGVLAMRQAQAEVGREGLARIAG